MLNLPDGNKPALFFQYTAHLFYGIIVAQSFELAKNNLIPINDIFSDSIHQVHSFGLFLAYFMVLSSWVGYYRSISQRPHTDKLVGISRYVLDVLIIFATFYLLHTSVTEHFTKQFHVVLLAIFILYVIWDYLKCKEYPEPVTRKKKRQTSRAGKTILFMIFLGIFGIVYQILSVNWQIIFSSQTVFEITFVIIAMSLIAVYRFWKWRVPTTRVQKSSRIHKSKKPNKAKS